MSKEKLMKIRDFLIKNHTEHICLNCLSIRSWNSDENEKLMRKCLELKHTIIENYDYEQDESKAIIKFINYLLKEKQEGK